MDYELAKELKEAGFPQKERMAYWMRHDGEDPFVIHPALFNRTVQSYADGYPLSEMAASPTLEELIEACGDDFYFLSSPTSHTLLDEKSEPLGFWRAKGRKQVEDGLTSEEAVARLWLALNKHE